MPLLAPGASGVIELEPTSSRLEAFFDDEERQDCVVELLRLGQNAKGDDRRREPPADAVLPADTKRLTRELQAEYAAMRAAIARARK